MKTQNPWMGRARGSAGNMTSSKVYDKNVMRAKAFEVNNPKTAAQTSERNFFAEAQKVCQTVSEEQLRSLFGVKPKSKSRRNALLSQLLSAYTINNGTKTYDYTKLYAIGNGPKTNAPFIEDLAPDDNVTIELTKEMFGVNATDDSLVYLVVYNGEDKLLIIDTGYLIGSIIDELTFIDLSVPADFGGFCGYFTIASDGSGESRPFGTFSLKTRAV